MTMFEHRSTNVVARPIDMPLRAELVVASVGHIPSTNTMVGFSLSKPLVNVENALFAIV
jgi:hypothetical protein